MSWTRRELLKNSVALGGFLALGIASLEPQNPQSHAIRPPGALAEEDFLSRCIRCRRCADACPNSCIHAFSEEVGQPFSILPGRGQEGTPVIFPRQQACNLCIGNITENLLCTAACPTGALQIVPKDREQIQAKVRMGKAEVNTTLCYSYNQSSCGVCIRACPFEGQALKASLLERPVIDLAYCVGCGLCERACIRYPQAITVEAYPEKEAL
jgi:ferredoxin-type protein NapG